MANPLSAPLSLRDRARATIGTFKAPRKPRKVAAKPRKAKAKRKGKAKVGRATKRG